MSATEAREVAVAMAEHMALIRAAKALREERCRKLHAEGLTDGQLDERLGAGAGKLRGRLGLRRNVDAWGFL